MVRIARASVLVGSLAAFSSVASAQTNPSLFLSGGALASIERDSYLDSPAFDVYPALNGTVPAGAVSIGAFLTERITVRAEFTFRGELESASSTTITSPAGVAYTETLSLADRVRMGSVLLAYHARTGKPVRFEYLGGLAFVYQRRKATTGTTISLPLPFGPPPIIETTSVTYGAVAVVGLDVPVRVARRVDLVPQIRAQSTSGLTIAAGVGVRVGF